MKIAIIGCTHAGTAAVREILRQAPETEVNIYERNDNISFLSCGISLYLNGRVKRLEDMFYDSAEDLRSANIHVNLQHDVLRIDRNKKDLLIQSLEDYSISHESYDKIILCTGSSVILPPINGIDHSRVLLCKNYAQARQLYEASKDQRRIALVGGGYVNVELAESFATTGHEVTLFQSHETILNNYVDEQISHKMMDLLTEHGVRVETRGNVVSFTDEEDDLVVTTEDGRNFKTDIAVVSTGFVPETDLLQGQVKMDRKGAIITNKYGQSSDPDIYVAGDARTIEYNPTGASEYIPLATNAVRQGLIAGINVFGNRWSEMGAQGTSAIELFGHTLSTTGLTYARALKAGFDADFSFFEDSYRPGFMPSTEMITIVIVYDKKDLRILGAQFFSKYDVAQSANTLSLAIQNRNTLKDLAFVDMLFQPYYDQPFNYINLAAQEGLKKEGLI
ncbi:NADH oxidase [Pediococcus stilesii]|uniref:NADH oxidase n=1 Tax=Pediococcus stilesii TaxID=331679 RepID=A0A5R9BRZ2_9LACO|nr:FAD-dependent oxidoreductase [Pediococcus stilesii]TLQ03486.1 NADH oxidase [Pediococcus stilesii]